MLLTLVFSVYLTGCATVPMAPTADDQLRKQFSAPSEGTSGFIHVQEFKFWLCAYEDDIH